MTVILILIYTGVRISELLDLEKKDIHLDERWFFVRESKTESGIREVPIAEKIVPFFEYWLSRDCDYLQSTFCLSKLLRQLLETFNGLSSH
jgi:integrase